MLEEQFDDEVARRIGPCLIQTIDCRQIDAPRIPSAHSQAEGTARGTVESRTGPTDAMVRRQICTTVHNRVDAAVRNTVIAAFRRGRGRLASRLLNAAANRPFEKQARDSVGAAVGGAVSSGACGSLSRFTRPPFE
ncbi:hypothetical protein [Nocardia callitridis]|uniref:Uncharacterized protein n=1 Tax=Nocardia callitridis TaxID=648753 RepID=A0ABP9K327_9NOCA